MRDPGEALVPHWGPHCKETPSPPKSQCKSRLYSSFCNHFVNIAIGSGTFCPLSFFFRGGPRQAQPRFPPGLSTPLSVHHGFTSIIWVDAQKNFNRGR